MKNSGFLLQASNSFVYTNITIELPEKNSILVEYLYCSICGGDYSQYIGRRKNFPVSLGHEFIARVITCGENVTAFHSGDYVTSDFNYRCNSCSYCKIRRSHLCIENDKQVFSHRAFFQLATIDFSYLYKIEPVHALYVYTLVEPLSCVLHALEMYDLRKISTIMINGTGSIGMLFSFYLRIILRKKIYIHDKNKKRKESVIKQFQCLPYDETSKYDLIVEATNSIVGCKEVLHHTRNGQQICMMTHLYGEETSFIYESCCKKELQVQFPLRNGERKNMEQAIRYLNLYWKVEYNSLLSIYNFQDLPSVFANKMEDSANKQIIKIASVV